ncbi:MAG: hypothetical protein J07HQW1_01187 [Haloquadratum walsbyi J07HQW1]|jgi:hypothetical protein|uniref:Uncharacterized protein n=1 Tax=Haloquadratum walsbyi J07HQW1 TaxID=1238424 RepID=U1N3N3_9EURY|nr:MAG: hypothetical protein J07HQW1_01187 [Haloquadratum walsbyi J07HQW1]
MLVIRFPHRPCFQSGRTLMLTLTPEPPPVGRLRTLWSYPVHRHSYPRHITTSMVRKPRGGACPHAVNDVGLRLYQL